MTKTDLKKLIQEVYEEVATEVKKAEKAEKPKAEPRLKSQKLKSQLLKKLQNQKNQARLPRPLSRQLTNTVIKTDLLVTKVMLTCLVKSRKYLLHMLVEN